MHLEPRPARRKSGRGAPHTEHQGHCRRDRQVVPARRRKEETMGRLLGTIIAVAIALSPAGAARAQDKLVVWWNKGFYEAEDKTIQAAIAKWEQQSGTRVELSLFSLEDIVTKTVSAVEAGSPPDLAFGW